MTQGQFDLRGLNFEEGYIAVLDKPLEWTSTDVVRKIKFALQKAGYKRTPGPTPRWLRVFCWSASAARPRWWRRCKPKKRNMWPM